MGTAVAMPSHELWLTNAGICSTTVIIILAFLKSKPVYSAQNGMMTGQLSWLERCSTLGYLAMRINPYTILRKDLEFGFDGAR